MDRIYSRSNWLALAGASLLGSIGLTGASSALAQAQAPAQTAAEAGTVSEEVIITGTRRTDRTVADSSAPIDVLPGGELTNYPSGNMLDTVTALVPAFVVGQNSISDAASFVRSPSLRGLPADEMLVLFGGKRFNRSALVQVFTGGENELALGSQGSDLATIPSIAVKNLEVLRDGAAAQYGSDAIAGVLNYQFRNNSSGVEFFSRGGQYYPGSGYSKDGTDYEFALNFGLPLSSAGFANFSFDYSNYDQTVRNATRPSAVSLAANFPNLAPGLPHYPGPVQQWGTPPAESFLSLLNAGVNLDNGSQLYFLLNYSHINSNESFNYRNPLTTTDPNTGLTWNHHGAYNTIYQTKCTPAIGCPTGGFVMDNNTFTYNSPAFFPSGFTPRFFGTTQELFTLAGYKGTTDFGMTYDVSGSFAQNSLAVRLKTTVNPSYGPQSPTNFDDGKFQQQESTLNFDVTYPWKLSWLVSPLNVAAGVEWHNELYQQFLGQTESWAAGPYASEPLYTCAGGVCSPAMSGGKQIVATALIGSNGYGGISAPVDASQHNTAVYLDLEADVLKNLTIGLAGRYENFTNFGNTTNGKFSIRWKVIDWLALRGTASTGFHAPSPGQSNVQTISTTFLPNSTTNVQIGTYPVTSPIAQFYGAVPLKPEKSTNLSAGIVLTPTAKMLLTLDFYQIKVNDRISVSQTFTVTPADIANLPALATVGAGGTVQYYTNGFDTNTSGADLVATYPFTFGRSTLNFTLAYNYNFTTVPSYNPTVISQARIVDIAHLTPNNRLNLILDYHLGPFGARLQESWYDTWRDEFDYAGQLFSAKYTTDLDISYQVWRDVTLAIGGKNITNTYPDKIANGPSATVYPNTGGLADGEVYPRTGGPFGYNGAFYYARMVARF